ncbi:SCO family protein [Alcanivorax quisquiliarum]|uniref:SCO family protein n=1 Tax=Alcanivorax quisquiliarum TaxID=2933565 RepID=A0ABT0E6N4_9GAMM|nr:SCO family protein [Alcanivorax quisquiliarum]MCK0537282.1 SCO family protein [Alcanivorax quisquiliarum]
MKRLILMTIAVLGALAVMVLWQIGRGPAVEPLPINTRMVGEFEMTDQTGARFHSDALRGQVVLMFFGFTHCPDICPATMARMAQLYKDLERTREAADVQVVFVTFDPERDTPEYLQQYLAWFHPDFIGLTGSTEDVERITSLYSVVYMPMGEDRQGGTEFAHSDFVYLLDRETRVRKLFPVEADLEEIKRDLRSLL